MDLYKDLKRFSHLALIVLLKPKTMTLSKYCIGKVKAVDFPEKCNALANQ